MAGIQQDLQLLLKRIGKQHQLWSVVKEIARLAGVLSDGALETPAASLHGQDISILSPRHEFLRQFDVALKLLYEIQQKQVELKSHADVWAVFQDIQAILNQQIQVELNHWLPEFREFYLKMCRWICTSKISSSIQIADVRDFFNIPFVDAGILEAAKKQVISSHISIGSRKEAVEAKAKLDDMLIRNDPTELQAFSQAGYEPAIKKLYSTQPNKEVACHLVNALYFSNMAGIKHAIELLDFAKVRAEVLNFLLNIMIQALSVSTIGIDSKRKTTELLYKKFSEIKSPEIFLNLLIMIEIFFLKDCCMELTKRQSSFFSGRKDALFTAGYLLQLACVRIYNRFEKVPSYQGFCKKLLVFRAKIAGDQPCYYISPEDILGAKQDEKWSLERFDCSARLKSPEKSICLVM